MITFITKTKITIFPKRLYKRWIRELIKSKDFRCGEINYIFGDDEYLLQLNQQYLNHDTYTDIITFGDNEENTISGDIFISIDRVKENAKTYKTPFENELLRVMAHGILHLCGFNDKKTKESKKMRREEDKAIILFYQERELITNSK